MNAFRLFNQLDLLLLGDLAGGLDAVVEDLLALEEHVGGFAELAPQCLVVLLAGKARGLPLGLEVDYFARGTLPGFVVVDVFGQEFGERRNERFFLAFVDFELGAHPVVVFLDRVKRFAGQPKERVRQFLERFAWRRTDVEPLLLKSPCKRFALLEVFHGGQGLGLLNESLFQFQVLLQVVLLELLVDVDVVEELVAQTVVLVVGLFVAVAGNVARGFPLLPNLVETRKRGTDVFLFLDDAPKGLNQSGLDLQVGTLLFGNALTPGLFTGFELVHQLVELKLFGTGLELEFLVVLVLLLLPGLALGAEVFLDQGTKRIDVGAHILADGLQILVLKEGLDTLQKFRPHGGKVGGC